MTKGHYLCDDAQLPLSARLLREGLRRKNLSIPELAMRMNEQLELDDKHIWRETLNRITTGRIVPQPMGIPHRAITLTFSEALARILIEPSRQDEWVRNFCGHNRDGLKEALEEIFTVTDETAFGQAVKILLEMNGQTQAAIASRIKMDFGHFSMYMKTRLFPKRKVEPLLQAICLNEKSDADEVLVKRMTDLYTQCQATHKQTLRKPVRSARAAESVPRSADDLWTETVAHNEREPSTREK